MLLVIAHTEVAIDVTAIRMHLRKHPATWWIPERIEVVSAFPLTATGKISKKELREQYAVMTDAIE